MKNETIIITGAMGWLGKRLVRLLSQGVYDSLFGGPPRLRALVLPTEGGTELQAFAPRLEIVYGDLRDAAVARHLISDTEGPIVIHTAGVIHPRRVQDFFDINLNGTMNLVRASRGHSKRVVIVSSNSPIGCNPHRDHLFDEDSPYNPYMGYGRSKMQMELAVQEYAAEGGPELVIVRPPWFYGPDQPARQTLFFRMIRQGKMPVVGDGENKRSMAYVDNLCQGLVLAATVSPKFDNAAGRIYWIADDRPYTMNEIVGTVERLLEEEFHLQVAHKRLRLPGVAGSIAEWSDAMLQSAGIYQQKIHVLSEMNKTIACSVLKARRELGYAPEIALEEGMRRSIQWCVDKGIAI